MIRLLPLSEPTTQRKRNKSYSEGVESHSRECKAIHPHPKLQTSGGRTELKSKTTEECLSLKPSEKWEAKLENLEQVQQELKATERKLRNQRGYFMVLYCKHPQKLQKQRQRLP